jgi:hypothetical protein
MPNKAVMSKNPLIKVSFSGSPLVGDSGNSLLPKTGIPCLYLLCKKDEKSPFYIGEYGKSQKYDVVTRIKRHFGSSGTLARVSNNMHAFGYNLPEEFDAYIKPLIKKYENTCYRESLEAWVIHKICHVKKTQNSTFCVTKHIAPKHNLSQSADDVINEFDNYS